jgi:Secretion system C-terminal sorting domain
MKIMLSFLFVSCLSICKAQLSHYVISSAGVVMEASNLHVEFTLGETCITTLSTEEIVLTQGFHQPLETTPIDNISTSENTPFSIYPNPSAGKINIHNLPSGFNELRIYDSLGALCQNIGLQKAHEYIDLTELSSGFYLITFCNSVENVVFHQSLIIQH